MSSTKLIILCDLDDTLLKNDFNTFLPAYLKAFSKTITLLPEKVFVSNLLSGTNQMISNQNPTRTLQDVFDAAFFSAVGLNKTTLEPIIDHFYGKVFHTLQPLTAPIPESKKIIEHALERHHHTVIATNPLFPFTATAQRLGWAEISPRDYPYDLITTYETFHFSKPNIAYYAEILGKLGWLENLAVMIGNDLEEDIRPASALGLPTYWINPTMQIPNFERHPLSGQGDLSGVVPWLEKVSEQSDNAVHISLQSLPHVLQSTPAVFDSLFNRDHLTQKLSTDNTTSHFFSELTRQESAHLETLKSLLAESSLNQIANENLPALDQEANYLQAYFCQRKTLLTETRNFSNKLQSPEDDQGFYEFLKTVAHTDQNLIREITALISG